MQSIATPPVPELIQPHAAPADAGPKDAGRADSGSTDAAKPDAGTADAAAPGLATLNLAALRGELDGIDDALHDLLMRRADTVTRLAASGIKGPVVLRPGREAGIVRRLLARHTGPLPRHAIVRLWRELLAASTGMQRPHLVAVCDTDPANGYTAVAREHFGALTPMRVHRSPAQALADVSGGNASVAVLPAPNEDDSPRDAWWTALLQKDSPRIHVIARLPFWAPRSEGAPRVQAYAIAAAAPDASGHDRSLLGFEVDRDVSRARLTGALMKAGLSPETVLLRREPNADLGHVLVEVPGMLTDDDPRLTSLGPLLRRPVVLGGYAVPEGAT